MSMAAVARSSFVTSVTRYARSWGLWLLLLTGPVGARFMIARDDGSGIQIAVGQHLPVMTSAMLGISLGIVVSTLLLPIGFLYLRSNVTRRQPWQVEEVTTASRLGIALGRFCADVSILFGMLAALTVAGWFLGWLIVSGPLDVFTISWTLWLVAAPAVMGLAAVHVLLDALPFTRRGWGDAMFFVLWMASLVMPAVVSGERSSLVANLYDFGGYVRPLVGPAPLYGQDIVIGGSSGLLPGRVPLDVIAGVQAPGYIASRGIWAALAVLIAMLAGLLYRPHIARRPSRIGGAVARLLAEGPPPAAILGAPRARFAAMPWVSLLIGEARLIGAGRLFKALAVIAAVSGAAPDYRHIGSPAALLVLVFALAAHAGRSEATGLLALTRTAMLGPWVRRAAFVVAGIGLSLLLALPAAVLRLSPEPLLLALVTGAAAASTAMLLATVSRSAFASRLVLLVAWYAYMS